MRGGGAAVAERLRDAAAADRERWPLWTPVGIGCGIAAYFALPAEPPGWAGAVAAILCAVLAAAVRRRPAVLLAVLALLAPAVGFAAGQARTALVAAPALERPTGMVTVTGRVVGLERQDRGGGRVVLADPVIERLAPAATPRRVRVRIAARTPLPLPGAVVRLRASLSPTPAPAEPGAFDFRRHAFFDGIGGVGFAVGATAIVEAPPPGGLRAVEVALEAARDAIAARVAVVVGGGAEGGITAALLNGERSGTPEAALQAMRDSGLAHLLSISGLHIGLVAGLVFFAVRALLALAEPVALRLPIKKMAALCGLLAAVAYTLMVGAPVPTLRALLMTGVVMVAIMLDRDPLSMRLVAFAAVAVLLALPDGMLGPSFQMSFAAVVALIAVYEVAAPVIARWRSGQGWAGRVALYAGGVALTSVVASAATTPYALFHFQTVAFYGVLANMLAVPVTAFWVMPAGLVAYALMPVGLDGPALTVMGWGVSVILWTAQAVSALPGATAPVPAMPVWGLAAVTLGGLWLSLWRRPWRFAGVVAVAAGLASPALERRPDVLVSGEGELMAVRTADGGLLLSSARSQRFTAGVWMRRDGRPERDGVWPAAGRSADGRLACDALGCVYRTAERTVALVRAPEALAEDCARADAVVSVEPAGRCAAPVVVDRWDRWRNGAHALYLTPDGVRVDSVRARRGERPWTGR
ncbi:ComEC/Rec2 family competence protein [Azospirillum halopraeferens]|uniref:ComEC/Rec2 family competence protein n=1 Tax=Azospirillum halopraeferens TaxID=34010 RepID=UPI0004236EEF|nr:ComEC/Rec2 family competence protein [Azospirillum halopraeferens]